MFAGAVVQRARAAGLAAVVPVAATETGRKGFTTGAELRSAGRVSPAGFFAVSLPSGHPDFTLSGQLVGLTGVRHWSVAVLLQSKSELRPAQPVSALHSSAAPSSFFMG
jgi:hypothetical protein